MNPTANPTVEPTEWEDQGWTDGGGDWDVMDHVIVYEGDAVDTYDGSVIRSQHDPDKVLTIFTPFPFYHTRYEDLLGATLVTGIERFCRKEESLQDYMFEIIIMNDFCNPKVAIPKIIELSAYIDVILGMRCSLIIVPAGYVTSYYDIPHFSPGSNDPELADKTIYDTFMRLSFSFKYVGEAFIQIFEEFGWTKAAVLAPNGYNRCALGIDTVLNAFNEYGIVITEWASVDEYFLSDEQLRIIVSNFKERARVFAVCFYDRNLRRFLEEAERQGMMTSEYIYITLFNTVGDHIRRPWGEKPEDMTSAEWEKKKSIYKQLKFVTTPDLDVAATRAFMEELWHKAQRPPFNKTLAPKETLEIDQSTINMHDSAYLWLQSVNESLHDGTNPRSGRNIFSKAAGVGFEGMSGEVVMDINADRINEYWMWQLQPGAEEFTPFLHIQSNSPMGQQLSYFEGEIAEWGTADGKPPPDTPPCGFFNELCPPSRKSYELELALGLGGLGVTAVSVALIISYIRKRRYEEDLMKMLWKVDYKDVRFLSKTDIGSLAVPEQIFTRRALYKGIAVAVKHAKKPKDFQITKAHLVELKQVKDLSHENLNSFVGACIELPDIFILSSYCAKGSLEDILGNDDIKLDKMFKKSLISDLANGMKCIHDSPIQSHGHLTSSCCLIDSRWVLKVTDVGLKFLKATDKPFEGTYKEHKKLLWCAPELLRTQTRPDKGTTKGDVYSFAIILQEILFRSLPYFIESMAPEDILEKVKKTGDIPFRPAFTDLPEDTEPALVELMKECWSEDPDDRPSFGEIKKAILSTNKGIKVNIMDTMVQKLERYANNLEDIVQQRTAELVIEKKKTDQLLYRMLPSVVAEQLKLGKTVHPELYEVATVYFSDIVGFTALSSQSTPMQVVDLLNDLYTCFDDIIALYDVYKVETIGDAYMCVSGIPKRNGSRHAAEIANMALALRRGVANFKIRHMPDTPVRIRIGVHTGPCAAGVVGLTMPRYCLFGDTVNTASRMESNSLAMKIHLSESAFMALEKLGGYVLLYRGEIEVKGKGLVTTYWLEETEDECAESSV